MTTTQKILMKTLKKLQDKHLDSKTPDVSWEEIEDFITYMNHIANISMAKIEKLLTQ